jgi:IS5 family transposase
MYPGILRSSAASRRCRKHCRAPGAGRAGAVALRAVVEHPFHIVKNRFHHKKLRYRGIKKNTAQLYTLFVLANLVIVK